MTPRKPKLTALDHAVITTHQPEIEDVVSTEPGETIRQLGGAEITGQQLAAESSFSADPDADARDAAQTAARDAAEVAAAAQEST